MRVFGAAGHGKGEVDSCGGHLKNPVHKHIAKGNNIRSANAVASYLMDKYDSDKYSNPVYHVNVISRENLEEREKRQYMRYDTVSGSYSFYMMVFCPGQVYFFASPHVFAMTVCV